MKKLLLLDNYDSFTYNLEQLIGANFDGKIIVKRNDQIDLDYIYQQNFAGIIISPGPKKPKDALFAKKVISEFYKEIPILGICLGMQCINEVFEGRTIRAPYPVHGKTSLIINYGRNIFSNIPQKIIVARYHSLMVEILSSELSITAQTEDGVIMALEHKSYPLFGVQFHPESFLTEFGNEIICNFLKIINERNIYC